VPVRANGQPAVGSYAWDEQEGAYLLFAIDVFTLEGDRIKAITSFINRSTESRVIEDYQRFPEQPISTELVQHERFGLAERLSD
jgi:hypothetical protein